MLAVARRVLLASGAASRRRAGVWPPLVRPIGRWLMTTTRGGTDDADSTSIPAHPDKTSEDDHTEPKQRETPWQKNAREFALLPKLLRVFEETTGHRVVPYHFVIPEQDGSVSSTRVFKGTYVTGRVCDAAEIPWPDEARGMNFGRVLLKFATNPTHYKRYKRVTEALDDMGYPLAGMYHSSRWREEVMAPLKVFYDIHKHCLVPQDFVVPRGDPLWPESSWGYALGLRVSKLRSRRHELNIFQREDLASLDFSYDAIESMWSDFILPALETYARIHENCRISYKFQVPHTDPWPRKAWGFHLGASVSNIRLSGAYAAQVERDQQRLEAIGFVWDHFEHMWSDIILPSLETFYRLEGHTRIPQSFAVPSEEPWPREAWGHMLGSTVSSIRATGIYVAQRARDADRLDAIDFVWDAMEHKWRNVILPALETFADKYGHCNVPSSFTVPAEAPWPEEAWGLKLGSTVSNIRGRADYAAQTARDSSRLEAIDFVWDAMEHKWRTVILPTLEMFANKHGHCNVPKLFEVPAEAPWPKEAWGLKLGLTVSNIRGRADYAAQTARDSSRLEAIDFVWDAMEHKWRTVILPTLEMFANKHGHCNVPKLFEVPAEAPWPKEAWGLKLGLTVSNIRGRGDYGAQTTRDGDRLEAIGFVWDVTANNWHTVVLALEAFANEYGHCDVPLMFKVPSESPWPKEAWGRPLGSICYRIRRQNAYAQYVERDVARLSAIGFQIEQV